MAKDKRSKLISVGKYFIGIVGLNEIFQNLFDDGKEPDRFLKNELLSLAKKKNYIPSKVEDEYREALLREYRNFYQKKKSGIKEEGKKQKDFYQGIPKGKHSLVSNCL